MKKIYAIAASCLMLAGVNASAQSLGNLLGGLTGGNTDAGSLLNSVSNVIYAFTGNTQAVSLPGTWNYGGAAIALGGYCMLVEFLLHITFGIPMYWWSLYPLVVLTLVGLLMIVIAISSPLRASLHKRFFI